MKCTYHKDREATKKCSRCGKPLCDECANMTNIGICQSCFAKSIRANAHEERGIVTPTAIMGMVGLIFGFIFGAGWYAFAAMAVLMLIPSGYVFLMGMNQAMFMKIPFIGELLYYLTRVLLSPFVGIYALPKYVYLLMKNR